MSSGHQSRLKRESGVLSGSGGLMERSQRQNTKGKGREDTTGWEEELV